MFFSHIRDRLGAGLPEDRDPARRALVRDMTVNAYILVGSLQKICFFIASLAKSIKILRIASAAGPPPFFMSFLTWILEIKVQ